MWVSNRDCLCGAEAALCCNRVCQVVCNNDPGSPFQLEMPGSKVIALDSSVLRIPLGRPAVVGIERGRGELQTVTPTCQVICKSAIFLRVERVQLLLAVTRSVLPALHIC